MVYSTRCLIQGSQQGPWIRSTRVDTLPCGRPEGAIETAYTCATEADPSEGDLQTIEHGLEAHDREHAGPLGYSPITVLGRDEAAEVRGGLRGTVGGGWLYIQTLWVDPAHRRRGLGARMVETAEAEALRSGCPRAFLNTLRYQAPSFYARLGNTVFAELEEAPGPHRRIFMRKELADRSDSLSAAAHP